MCFVLKLLTRYYYYTITKHRIYTLQRLKDEKYIKLGISIMNFKLNNLFHENILVRCTTYKT